MRNRFQFHCVLNALILGFLSTVALGEEPSVNASAAPQTTDAVQIDRDGKQVCGWNLMNDSERGGYKNIMHQTKDLMLRDEIRADHCARMRARAKERGVPAEE
jgi:hypothetical protein